MKLTVQEIQEWLTQFAEAINQNKQYLSDLDTPIGDGDHGITWEEGFQLMKKLFKPIILKQSAIHSKYSLWR